MSVLYHLHYYCMSPIMFFMNINCDYCDKPYRTLPSWYKRNKRHYCSKDCFFIASRERRSELLTKVGKATQFKPGDKPSTNRRLPTGSDHHAWKETDVSYRGLHYWVYRQKGKPTECVRCNKDTRKLQWANIDGKYRRDANDFVGMCASCHKLHDIELKRASRGSPNTTSP